MDGVSPALAGMALGSRPPQELDATVTAWVKFLKIVRISFLMAEMAVDSRPRHEFEEAVGSGAENIFLGRISRNRPNQPNPS